MKSSHSPSSGSKITALLLLTHMLLSCCFFSALRHRCIWQMRAAIVNPEGFAKDHIAVKRIFQRI